MTFAYAASQGAAAAYSPTNWPGAWDWPDGPGGAVPPWDTGWDFETAFANDGPWPPGYSSDLLPLLLISVLIPAATALSPFWMW